MRQWSEPLKPTPIQYLGKCGSGQEIYIKREDLLGFSFGGNKCRIGFSFLRDMEKKKCNYLITYGRKESNLNRILANMCRSANIPFTVVSPDAGEEKEASTFNSMLVGQMGGRYLSCGKTQVAEALEQVFCRAREEGFAPYYIYGDSRGLGNEAAAREAYQDAYGEIRLWEETHRLEFDSIFLASGTGMTQGGLLSGQTEAGGRERIVGISVARGQEAGEAGVRRYAGDARIPVCFVTDYICGGYGQYDEDVKRTIRMVMEDYGIPLDPVYTGKAYSGMLKWLKAHGSGGEKVLFIHTGGTPLYFDYLQSGKDGTN